MTQAQSNSHWKDYGKGENPSIGKGTSSLIYRLTALYLALGLSFGELASVIHYIMAFWAHMDNDQVSELEITSGFYYSQIDRFGGKGTKDFSSTINNKTYTYNLDQGGYDCSSSISYAVTLAKGIIDGTATNGNIFVDWQSTDGLGEWLKRNFGYTKVSSSSEPGTVWITTGHANMKSICDGCSNFSGISIGTEDPNTGLCRYRSDCSVGYHEAGGACWKPPN